MARQPCPLVLGLRPIELAARDPGRSQHGDGQGIGPHVELDAHRRRAEGQQRSHQGRCHQPDEKGHGALQGDRLLEFAALQETAHQGRPGGHEERARRPEGQGQRQQGAHPEPEAEGPEQGREQDEPGRVGEHHDPLLIQAVGHVAGHRAQEGKGQDLPAEGQARQRDVPGLLQDEHGKGDQEPAVSQLARDVRQKDLPKGRMTSEQGPQLRERLKPIHNCLLMATAKPAPPLTRGLVRHG